MAKKVALVTGGTSGIGLETAIRLKKKGYTVYEMSRRAEGAKGLCHLRADVTDEAQVRTAVEEVLQQEGHIDVLVNNAGFGISGAIEFTEVEEAKKQFDVNFFGVVNVTKAVLPAMRERGRGHIVNMSSVASPIAIDAITPTGFSSDANVVAPLVALLTSIHTSSSSSCSFCNS